MAQHPANGDAINRALIAAMQRVVQREGLHIKAESNKNAPRLTGMLRRSAKLDVIQHGDRHTATISYNTPYAQYQHEGVSRFTGRDLQYGRRSGGKGAVTDARIGAKYLERAIKDGASHQRLLKAIKTETIRAIREAM
jgi:hypothetical protein